MQLGLDSGQTFVSTYSLQLATSATDRIQKYIINMEASDQKDKARREGYEYDRWLHIQELGDDYYKLYENDSEEEDEEEVLRRMEWKEEEEKAKK